MGLDQVLVGSDVTAADLMARIAVDAELAVAVSQLWFRSGGLFQQRFWRMAGQARFLAVLVREFRELGTEPRDGMGGLLPLVSDVHVTLRAAVRRRVLHLALTQIAPGQPRNGNRDQQRDNTRASMVETAVAWRWAHGNDSWRAAIDGSAERFFKMRTGR
jgi:hypothetical protein